MAKPLAPDWTIEAFAEQFLDAVVAHPGECVVDAQQLTDRQSVRLMRPLLANLATKYAEATGQPLSLYEGILSFTRNSPSGPVSIVGEFVNRPGKVHLNLSRLVDELKYPGHHRENQSRSLVISSLGTRKVVKRRNELGRRYQRKMKLLKLKKKLATATGADREKILYMIKRLSPIPKKSKLKGHWGKKRTSQPHHSNSGGIQARVQTD
ncbi:MAG: DUF6800 family protein [Gemmataceae bacterium]